MNDASKVKVATAVTAVFLGGITAAGLFARSGVEQPATADSARTEVVHRKKVRTVRAPSAPAAEPVAATYAASPAPAAAPQPVSTRVSPTGGGSEDYGDDVGGEHEGEGESE